MKIQVAIDRVTVEQAIETIEAVKDYADIVEIGTSLIKDYGLESVRRIKKAFPLVKILADIKTIDEAEYEFIAVYEAGADIATVMGGSALASIEICRNVAQKYKKEYMIDLLEVSDDKLNELKQFKDAIFCVHLPADKDGVGLEALVEKSSKQLEGCPRLAVAGGVSLSTLSIIKNGGYEIAIVGGAITKAENMKEMARDFARKARD
ncbi:MAG: hypothetical protein K0R15_202 [Clostridiales bacterium]|jgi:3-hexulose-6-phosphate synthase|nr:hypothetical protein [Clostridiales bacterium]